MAETRKRYASCGGAAGYTYATLSTRLYTVQPIIPGRRGSTAHFSSPPAWTSGAKFDRRRGARVFIKIKHETNRRSNSGDR